MVGGAVNYSLYFTNRKHMPGRDIHLGSVWTTLEDDPTCYILILSVLLREQGAIVTRAAISGVRVGVIRAGTGEDIRVKRDPI